MVEFSKLYYEDGKILQENTKAEFTETPLGII
jgi:hypothetical protein